MNVNGIKEKFKRLDFEGSEEHMAKTLEFAEKRGITDKFLEKLEYLNNFRPDIVEKVRLFYDWAPNSFGFVMWLKSGESWLNGGMIYHGPGDSGVGAPTYSVRIGELDEGWSIHT